MLVSPAIISACMSSYERIGQPNNPTGQFNVKIDGRYIDPYHHLNHVAWGIHLEDGRAKLVEGQNIVIAGVPATKTFLQRTCIEFKDQIKEGDKIDITTTAKDKQGLIEFDQLIQKGGQLVGKASTTYGCPAPELTASSDLPLLDLSLKLDEEFFLLQGTRLDHLAAPACFEEERLRLLLSRGLTVDVLTKMGILVMATSLDAKYTKEMYVGQQVNVRTNVHNQGVKLIFHQQIVEDGQVVNEAHTIYVPIDIAGDKPKIIRPPAQLMEQLTGPQIKDVKYSRDTRWL